MSNFTNKQLQERIVQAELNLFRLIDRMETLIDDNAPSAEINDCLIDITWENQRRRFFMQELQVLESKEI